MRQPRWQAAVLIGFAAAASACGDPGSDSTPEDEVAAVAEAFASAWGATRCEDAADLTDGPRDDVVAECERENEVARGNDASQLRIGDVRIDGDTATVDVEVMTPDGKTESNTAELVLVGGEWKVAWG